MKVSLSLLCLLLCSLVASLAGPNDVLYMGKYYREVTVESVNGDKVKIHSMDGSAEIPWSALSLALRKANEAKREKAKPVLSVEKANPPARQEDAKRFEQPKVMPSASPATVKLSTPHIEADKVVLLPDQVRLRGHIKQTRTDGLLIECLEPMNVGTGKKQASPPRESVAYGIFLLKGHPMEADLVNNDPVNVVGTPSGIFSWDGKPCRIYSVVKADAR